MFEHRHQKLISKQEFALRIFKNLVVALAMMFAALLVGVLGYHHFAKFSWVDAFLDASMILGGMGPVGELHSDSAKLFASFYALFSGIFFIGIAAVLLAPLVHRFMHRFHLETEEEEKGCQPLSK
ncbi:MAG: hypothetical protein PHD76_06570 [Methylacidiphilales bacterium]|nr:hypothetical protein [Candidatus Methylacidiphilales bacterium]